MNWYNTLYWVTRLDVLNNYIFFLLCFFTIISVILLVAYINAVSSKEPILPKLSKLRKIFIPLSIVFGLLHSMLPTKNDMLLIIAAGSVLEYVEKDTSLQQIPYELSSYVKEQIRTARQQTQQDAGK